MYFEDCVFGTSNDSICLILNDLNAMQTKKKYLKIEHHGLILLRRLCYLLGLSF